MLMYGVDLGDDIRRFWMWHHQVTASPQNKIKRWQSAHQASRDKCLHGTVITCVSFFFFLWFYTFLCSGFKDFVVVATDLATNVFSCDLCFMYSFIAKYILDQVGCTVNVIVTFMLNYILNVTNGPPGFWRIIRMPFKLGANYISW